MDTLFTIIVGFVVLTLRTPFVCLGMIVGFIACALIDGWNEFMWEVEDE